MNNFESAMDVFYEVVKKEPFVYKIKQEYYLIGYEVFRICTDEQIKLYNTFLEEYRALEKDEWLKRIKCNKKRKEFKNISDIVGKLRNSSSSFEKDRQKVECEKIAKLMSCDDVNGLKSQLECYKDFCKLKVLYDIVEKLEER